jgi:DMSO/TMAO reductase YedYZ molybdopterin-dependent catalytic subunit
MNGELPPADEIRTSSLVSRNMCFVVDIPRRPTIGLGGDAQAPCAVALAELTALPRYEQTSDFHCVATWSRRGLLWSGYGFRDFYEQIVVPRARPERVVRYVVLRVWMDTGRFPLNDALADDVMLVDSLDGQALSLEHGAPIRLVAPAHYGYKSAKHLCG